MLDPIFFSIVTAKIGNSIVKPHTLFTLNKKTKKKQKKPKDQKWKWCLNIWWGGGKTLSMHTTIAHEISAFYLTEWQEKQRMHHLKTKDRSKKATAGNKIWTCTCLLRKDETFSFYPSFFSFIFFKFFIYSFIYLFILFIYFAVPSSVLISGALLPCHSSQNSHP